MRKGEEFAIGLRKKKNKEIINAKRRRLMPGVAGVDEAYYGEPEQSAKERADKEAEEKRRLSELKAILNQICP